MEAFILAAGLGTRLRPFTLLHPKALVEVGGRPMLGRVIDRLRDEGFDRIVVNVHHFPDQIENWLAANSPEGVVTAISDERLQLLETGDAILHAEPLLEAGGDRPFLIHNVDILSDAPLGTLMRRHIEEGNDVTLLVSARKSSRRLLFDSEGSLKGWHSLADGSWRPADARISAGDSLLAFSGIHVMSPSVFAEMRRQGRSGAFSVIDFLLEAIGHLKIKAYRLDSLRLIDIGKPETLSQANQLF